MLELRDVMLQLGEQTVSVKDYRFEDQKKYVISAVSGKGKTTLIEGMMGLNNNLKGEVLIDGDPFEKDHRNLFAYLPQSMPDFNESVTDLFPLLDVLPKKELIEALHLNHLDFNKPFHQFSGGEKKRIGLLIALSLKRRFLLIDEIEHGLDRQLLEKVVDVVLDASSVVVVVSHHPLIVFDERFVQIGGDFFE